MSSGHESFWSERYRSVGDDYLFGTAPSRFLACRSELLGSLGDVLSVADGEGRNAVWLAEQGCRVTATEISPVALAKAARLARGRHVEVNFVQADLLAWDWPVAAFDGVIGVFIQFVGAAERQILFDAMKRALRPGGVLLLHGYTPRQLDYRTGGPSAVENLYTVAMLEAEFAGWEILELREYEESISEGSGHAGQSALIDLVARRP
ncbi:MAG: class I SAM-dependent methyltransferase [Dechloromonas sp.]|nr:MAG: class I SAM-dependent methyltransferase [Dechloromonas sp.]